jgi:hypothetical protein
MKSINMRALFLFYLLIVTTQVNAIVCIGHDYEQQIPLTGTTLPVVKITTAITAVKEGQATRLTADATIDAQGKAFYYWCTDKGSFTKITDDYKTVLFIPPASSGNDVANMWVKVGDSLGYIDSAKATITIEKQIVNPVSQDANGLVQFTFNSPTSGNGTVKINNAPADANWSANSVSFNLFQATQTTAKTQKAIQLSITDSSGKVLYDACYPFVDVCPNRWFSTPVMKLWKEGIIEGYNSGKSGIFGAYNNATRAEFIAAVVRAVNQNIIPTITNSPFEDVKPEDWYAGAVEYAKNQGWVSGCNVQKTRFCPNDPISRAEAAKILSLAFERVKTKASMCQTNQTANFSDVSADAWYAQYACATKAANVISGYPNKIFRPTNPMIRAEMAKAICAAAFGVSECIESGDLNRPMILSVSPSTGTVNQPVTLSIEGFHLPQPLKLNLPNCQNIQYVSGGNTEKQLFTCTPTVAGQLQGQVLDNNNTELFKFILNIQGVTTTTTDTTTTPPAQELPVEMAGNETASFLLGDNSVANSCTFTDIDQAATYAQPVNLFCSAAILIGYSVDGQRVFKPNNAATLAEVLKVLLFANDYRHIGETLPLDDSWVAFIINEAKTKGLNLGVLTTNDLIKRRQAMMWVAQLFYNYTGFDPITFLKTKNITNGERPDDNVTRSEIVLLAYRAAQDVGRYIHYGLVGSPPPALPTSGLAQAIANAALQAVGTKYPYVDSKYTYSARFVRMMFEKPAVWADAKTMCGFYASKGVLKTTQNPPVGAVVCYSPSSVNGNYGHVAIALGDGNEVGVTSLSAGVSKRSIVYGASYQGWINADDFNSQYP